LLIAYLHRAYLLIAHLFILFRRRGVRRSPPCSQRGHSILLSHFKKRRDGIRLRLMRLRRIRRIRRIRR